MNKAGFFNDGQDLWAWDLKGRIYKNGKRIERHLVPLSVQNKLTSTPDTIPSIAKESKRTTIENSASESGKTADYFYDWQGYYPDDGSLEDGLVNPAAPAPSFIERPNRCQNPGHLINTEELDKDPAENCPECGKSFLEHSTYGVPNAMEYDEMLQHSPWWRSGAKEEINPAQPRIPPAYRTKCPYCNSTNIKRSIDRRYCQDCGYGFNDFGISHDWWKGSGNYFDLPEWEDFDVVEPPSNYWNRDFAPDKLPQGWGAQICPACHNEIWRNPHNCTDGPPPLTFPEEWSKGSAMHEDEQWPLVWESGPWRFVWNGGRLMDIYDRASGRVVEGIQATAWDGVEGKPIYSDDPYRDMIERAMCWMGEDAKYYENELPYMPPSDEPPMMDDYPDQYFPEDWTRDSAWHHMNETGPHYFLDCPICGSDYDYRQSMIPVDRNNPQLGYYYICGQCGQYTDPDAAINKEHPGWPEDWAKASSEDNLTDWMIQRSQESREQQALENRGTPSPLPWPNRYIQESIYKRRCPTCGGYLEKRGDFYTCQACPFEYPPGGERTASPKDQQEIIPGQTKIPYEYEPGRNYWSGLKHDYEEMAGMLGDKDSIKMPSRGGYRASNAFLERRADGGIALRLHDTDIITYYPDYFILNTGGWNTMTTRQWINNWIPRGSIYNFKGDLMYDPGRGQDDPAYQDPYRHLEVDRPGIENPEETEGFSWENWQKEKELRKQYPDVNNDPSYFRYPDAYHWQVDSEPSSGFHGPWGGTEKFKVDYTGEPIWDEEYKSPYRYTSTNPFETDVRDLNETPIVVGSRVRVPAYKEWSEERGVVTHISEPDGDVDDYGRSIGIYPKVTVLFDNGDEDSFTTTIDHRAAYNDDWIYVCEDIELVPSDMEGKTDYIEGQLSFDKWYEPGKQGAKEEEELHPQQMSIPSIRCPRCGSPDWEEDWYQGLAYPMCSNCKLALHFTQAPIIWPHKKFYSKEEERMPGQQVIPSTGACPYCGSTDFYTTQNPSIFRCLGCNLLFNAGDESGKIWNNYKQAEYEEYFDDPIDAIQEARELRDEMLEMGWSDKQNLVVDMAIELMARGTLPDSQDAYMVAEEVVAEIEHKIYDAYMGADPGKDWPDLSPTRDFPGDFQWKNTWWPIGMPRNQGKVAGIDEEEAKRVVMPVIDSYPGGWKALVEDIILIQEAVSDPDHTPEVAQAYDRLRTIVGEHFNGDILEWAMYFNKFCDSVYEIQELDKQFRNSKIALGFDNPSADRYRIDTPMPFRDHNSPELLMDMDFLDSEPASFLNVERQYPRKNEKLDTEDIIPYHGHPVR